MKLSGWGNYPIADVTTIKPVSTANLKNLLMDTNELIARGNGRSYGDSSICDKVVVIRELDYFLGFDSVNGILDIQAGVLLSDIIDSFVPRGWFLQVTPGTKLITVGGAIASDVHGKNHHKFGCFSESVIEFRLMLPDGSVKICSKTENRELFLSTCGGMGLTGFILDAKIQLKKINSQFIDQTTIKTRNLNETFETFEKYKDFDYSVAWIDCLAKHNELGKCLLTVGKFCNDADLNYRSKKKLNIPFSLPSFILNPLTVKAFNWLYYKKTRTTVSHQKVGIDTFFYPLDSIRNWNRIYGKSGFLQYQFILPISASRTGLREILNEISRSGKGSFLAVLKLYGKENSNYLSFPIEGYSLALDFKIEKGVFALLDRLDSLVVKNGGRIYLAKDARIKKSVFEKGYEKINKFRDVRNKYKLVDKFNSLQSKRLGI